uniref:Uncharacterized protein n=1 Tax=Salmonella phage PMBT27 TaxID=3137285 RepID=A0AAU8BUJ3_9VIRU
MYSRASIRLIRNPLLPIYHVGIIKWLLTFSPLRYILLSFS